MLNQVVLVGKIHSLPTMEDKTLMVEVDQQFQNSDGSYEKMIFPIKLWYGITKETISRYRIGTFVGIKGRLEMCDNEIVIAAERVSYITPADP